jgi:UDP-N-acetylmuramate dehydrogenase
VIPVPEVREQVALAGYTTLRLGGPARRFVAAASEADVVAQVRAADAGDEPLLVLGGGSNLVVADEGFPGTVVKVASKGVRCAGAGPVTVTVAAGEDWDSVVAWSVSEGLAGLECLSGIPGLAGATPIQNVGAYGQEVAETITTVRAYDRRRGEIVALAAADCGFGYRTSAFKRDPWAGPGGRGGHGAGASNVTGRFVVLDVTFQLARSPLSAPVRYRELAGALGVAEGARAPLADVRTAVLALRRGKGMVLDEADPDTRSAGSFFTNPVLDEAQFAALEKTVAATLGPGTAIRRFPAPGGFVKVSAAWLIERAGFGKGYPGPGRNGTGPRISSKHTLALVNPGGATTASLLSLAREVRDGVRATFGVDLTPEPVLVATRL